MIDMPRAPRRAFVLTATVTVVAFALSMGAFFLGLRAVRADVARASQVTTGTVIETDVGDEGDIRVQWKDLRGGEHHRRFVVYGSYEVGEDFELRYDPVHPEHRAYPADPDETDYEDGYLAGAFASPAFGALFLLGLALRRHWWRRAVRRAVTPEVPATVVTGEFNGSSTTWLCLRDGEERRWQMVMWDPALESLHGPTRVRVHGDLEARRRVAVELADGTLLVSQGRLRHREAGNYTFAPRAATGASLAEALVVPTGAQLPTAHPWWRTPALWGAVGAVLGGVVGGVLITQRLWVGVALALAFAAGAVNAWTLNGAEQ